MRGPDGGLYLPQTVPVLSQEITQIFSLTTNSCIADILNRLLDCHLSNWDVDFTVGRNIIRTRSVGHNLIIAESWHNPDATFSSIAHSLCSMICDEAVSGIWGEIAARISVLFALFGNTQKMETQQLTDVAVISGDFSAVVSAWYAKAMGLPIGKIILCCNENHSPWELLHHGVLRTDGIAENTSLTEADVVIPFCLESLLYLVNGRKEVCNFVACSREGKPYFPTDTVLQTLNEQLYVSVVGENRTEQTIRSILQSYDVLVSPYTALLYAGVQDYRSRSGKNRRCLLLSERGPECDQQFLAKAFQVSQAELSDLMMNR